MKKRFTEEQIIGLLKEAHAGIQGSRSSTRWAATRSTTAFVSIITVPAKDRFRIVTEHDPEALVFDCEYPGTAHRSNVENVQITLSAGRSVEFKRAF